MTTMATSCIFVVILMTVISQVHTSPYYDHIYFQYLRNLTTTTTTAPKEAVVVDDRVQVSNIKLPANASLFINYLVTRPTYYQINGWGGRSNSAGISDRNIVMPSKPTTARAGDSSSSTTRAQATSTTTSTTTTTRNNQEEPRYPNSPDMIPFPKAKKEQPSNRQGQIQIIDDWLNKIRRPPIQDSLWNRLTTTTNSPVTTNQPDDLTSEFPSDKTTDIPSNRVTGDKRGPDYVEIQEKPFYGANLEWFFTDNIEPQTTSQTRISGDRGRIRYRRAVDINGASGYGTSCTDPDNFEPCQYTSRCIPSLSERCGTRDSFIGDKVNRFCVRSMSATQPASLRTYVRKVDQCLRRKLVQFLESPTCDDITSCQDDALLVKSKSSCLFLDGLFCNLTEDSEGRPALARLLNQPTTDVDFMSRLMINIGDLTGFCKGSGGSILVTDLTVLAQAASSPFKDVFANMTIPNVG